MALYCECPKNSKHNTYNFQFGGQNLDTVDEYKCLGIYLSKIGSFKVAKQHFAEQANKTLSHYWRKIKL